MATNIRRIAVAAAMAAATAGCTMHSTEPPPLAGPSELALTLRLTASPTTVTQDGASTSSITVLALDENGRPKPNVPLRVDLMDGAQLVDFGTLSARSLMTGASGTAFVTFTAPPTPPNGLSGFGTCNGVLANCISIVAAQTNGDNFANVNPASVELRLVPPGNIVPTGDWAFAPAAPHVNESVTFSGSGVLAPPGRTITGYRWDFNDGSAAKFGAAVTHDFGLVGTYDVVLTTTDDSGATKAIGKRVTVG
jgi:hypothetical protein